MLTLFDYKTPIGRKDYFFSYIKRFIILVFIFIIYSLLDLIVVNPNKSFDIKYIIDLFKNSYGFGVKETFLFLSLDIRRLKNIGISLNWLFPYLLISSLPASTDQSNIGYLIIESILTIGLYGFIVFLFIKKGSSKLSSSTSK